MNDLWCMHVLGPDDLHPAPSKEAAERMAARLNEVWAKREQHPLDPEIAFVVERWTGSEETHSRYAETWDDRMGVRHGPDCGYEFSTCGCPVSK